MLFRQTRPPLSPSSAESLKTSMKLAKAQSVKRRASTKPTLSLGFGPEFRGGGARSSVMLLGTAITLSQG